MAIMAPMGGNGGFQVHPEGQFAAVCVDVVDVGLVEYQTPEGPKIQHKVDLYWYCGHDKTDDAGKTTMDADGRAVPLLVKQRYTLSSHERSTLRKHLEGWYAKTFDNATLAKKGGFDVEKVLGRPCLLIVTHAIRGDNTYANVTGIMALPKGMDAPEIPDGYIRVIDRPPREDRPQYQNAPAQSAPVRAPAKINGNQAQPPAEPWPDEPSAEDELPF